jgi:competence protein ComEC
VLRATFGGVSFLLTGDLEAGGEALLGPRPANVLKVGHHGSRTSSSAALLAATRPRLAVASLGSGNHFGHPHPEVVRRLSEGGAHVLRTDRDGTIDVATDGTSVAVCTGRGGCSAAW